MLNAQTDEFRSQTKN